MTPEEYGNRLVVELKALGFEAEVLPYTGIPDSRSVGLKSQKYRNIPIGPCVNFPNGGVHVGVAPVVISPQFIAMGITPEVYAPMYVREAERVIGLLKLTEPTLGEGYWDPRGWFPSASDVPAPDVPYVPVPYVEPPRLPGAIETPFGPIYPSIPTVPIVLADKAGVLAKIKELLAMLGL